jgi:phosphoribosyl 1,2-cyclic phosphodiesterase
MDEDSFLIDAGISARKIEKTLKEINVSDISAFKGILVTHEHTDHIKGIKTLSKKFELKNWITFATYNKIRSKTGPIDTEFVEIAEPFNIGEVEVIPYEIQHDAAEPVGYVLKKGNLKIGVLMDSGGLTTYLIDGYRDLDVLIIEANHSFDRLLESDYPIYLKERILSSKGHLSNWDTANFLFETQPKLAIITHISENNNSISSVLSEIEEEFAKKGVVNLPFIVLVPPDSRSSIISIK